VTDTFPPRVARVLLPRRSYKSIKSVTNGKVQKFINTNFFSFALEKKLEFSQGICVIRIHI
jgi:hypothetical protein